MAVLRPAAWRALRCPLPDLQGGNSDLFLIAHLEIREAMAEPESARCRQLPRHDRGFQWRSSSPQVGHQRYYLRKFADFAERKDS
jgi:hypothetical protein